MNQIIETNKLQRMFGEHKAVDEMTFHVKQGEVFGLLRPDCTGKTTTVQLLNSVLRHRLGLRVFLYLILFHKVNRSAVGQSFLQSPYFVRTSVRAREIVFFWNLQEIPDPELNCRVDEK